MGRIYSDGHGQERFRPHFPSVREAVVISRLIMVAEHGYDAVCDNQVHHKNEIPWDNRPSNLEVLGVSEHHHHHTTGENAPWSELTEGEVIEIRERYSEGGVTHRELAEEYGVVREAVSRVVRGVAWSHVGGPTGRKFTQNKLTDGLVRDVRRYYRDENVSQGELAERFDVNQQTISNLVRGETRREAGGPIKGEDY